MEKPGFIQVTDLTKAYSFGRVRALDDVNLTVEAGEIFGLIGPNGAGKTTLMGCLLGLLWPSKGSVSIDGRSPSDLAVKAMTGFMPERPSFDKWMTITQFMTYQYMLTGQPFKNAKATIDEALEAVQLEKSAWKRPIKKLSRGMLQRVGLAQIYITKARLCFLDEPTSGMDPIGMALVRDLLLKWKAAGATIVLNSHHLDEVEKICDRVAFIQQGKIQAIERMKTVPNSECTFVVRWDEARFVGGNHALVDEIAAKMQIKVIDKNAASVKLLLCDPKQAADVVQFFVTRGMPVLEATYERKALLDLFVGQR